MAEAKIVPATEAHARDLAPRMRADDVAEVKAAGNYEPLEALLIALDRSSLARTLLIDGEVAAVFGVGPFPRSREVGVVWLLGSTTIDRHPLAFLRACRRGLPSLFGQFRALINAIDARYSASVRWARWLGFAVAEPAPFGVAGLPFHLIRIERRVAISAIRSASPSAP